MQALNITTIVGIRVDKGTYCKGLFSRTFVGVRPLVLLLSSRRITDCCKPSSVWVKDIKVRHVVGVVISFPARGNHEVDRIAEKPALWSGINVIRDMRTRYDVWMDNRLWMGRHPLTNKSACRELSVVNDTAPARVVYFIYFCQNWLTHYCYLVSEIIEEVIFCPG